MKKRRKTSENEIDRVLQRIPHRVEAFGDLQYRNLAIKEIPTCSEYSKLFNNFLRPKPVSNVSRKEFCDNVDEQLASLLSKTDISDENFTDILDEYNKKIENVSLEKVAAVFHKFFGVKVNDEENTATPEASTCVVKSELNSSKFLDSENLKSQKEQQYFLSSTITSSICRDGLENILQDDDFESPEIINNKSPELVHPIWDTPKFLRASGDLSD